MTFEQLMKLLDAGFTKQEIMALNGTQEPAPQPEPEPEPQPEPAPAPQNDLAAILAQLEELNQTILRSNINNSRQPDTESVDDILATIIRPTFKSKEEK